MEERRAECALGVLYVLSVILSVTSLVSLVTVWQHWTWTLDVCISIDCGCILYGINTFSTFMGGDVKLCQFGVYGLIPTILVGLCLGGYHGYRCCINRNLDKPARIRDDAARNLKAADPVGTVMIRPKTRSPYKHWIPIVFLAILFCCLSLAHAIVMTDGYYKTCDQYRKRLIHLMGSTGGEAEIMAKCLQSYFASKTRSFWCQDTLGAGFGLCSESSDQNVSVICLQSLVAKFVIGQVIHDRLSCGSIFDFMDYLQPEENHWRRDKRIDTGFALRLAIVSTWLNSSVWTFICLVSVIMARKRLCCC